MEFSDFVDARRTTLVRAAVLMGHSTADAEDLVQATLTKAFRSWRKVRGADNIDGYVYRILVNTAHDRRSRKWTGETPTELLPESLETDERSGDLTTGMAVRRALDAMSREHREVLVLRFFLDLSEATTAEMLGLPAGTVKSRTSRALAALASDESVRSLQ